VARRGGCVDSRLRTGLEGRTTTTSGVESGESGERGGCIQSSVYEEAWSLSLAKGREGTDRR